MFYFTIAYRKHITLHKVGPHVKETCSPILLIMTNQSSMRSVCFMAPCLWVSEDKGKQMVSSVEYNKGWL